MSQAKKGITRNQNLAYKINDYKHLYKRDEKYKIDTQTLKSKIN